MALLSTEPENVGVKKDLLEVLVNYGDSQSAYQYARELNDSGDETFLSDLVQTVELFENRQYQEIIDWSEESRLAADELNLYGFMNAWANFAAGDVNLAIERFDELAANDSILEIAKLQQGLAYASVGDFGSARQALEKSGSLLGTVPFDSQNFLDNVTAQVADPSADAGSDPAAGSSEAAGQEIDFEFEISPQLGVSTFLSALGNGMGNDHYWSLIFTRLAQFLYPESDKYNIWIGRSLRNLGNFELAESSFQRIPEGADYFRFALAERSSILHDLGKTEESFSILSEYAEKYSDSPDAYWALGDAYRRAGEFERADEAYSDAISLLDDPDSSNWQLYFARGIVREQTGDWDSAKTDLRTSLELSPDQPLVLNYLGYSMVVMDEDLVEAERLIEKAVELEPNSGFILDSLGWVLYRRGLYEEAVLPMEKAISLEPSDPVINDHLGDVYWMVGRHREAEFQWKRALSFDPEPDEAKRIGKKLKFGLDHVLAQE